MDDAPADPEERGRQARDRYDRTGSRDDLEEAVRLLASSPGDLAGVRRRRYELLGDPDDLEQAIALGRTVVAGAAADHPERGRWLSDLALALFDRDAAGLTEATGLAAEAVECARDPSERAKYQHNLALILRERHLRDDSREPLDRALGLLTAALAATPDGPHRPVMLALLGSALRDRFHLTGDPADLDRAVDAGREAVGGTPAGHRECSTSRSELGMALMDRYELAGDHRDLDEAVTAARDTLTGLPAGHRNRAMYQADLAFALGARYDRTGSRADLDEAVAAAGKAVAAAGTDDPERVAYAADHKRLADLRRGLDAGAVRTLLEAVNARIDAYWNGNPTRVTSDEARGEAAALADLLRREAEPIEDDEAALLGWFHLIRFTELPPEDAVDDLAAAVVLFSGVSDPGLVPDRMRLILEHGPEDWAAEGAELMDSAIDDAVLALRRAVAAAGPGHPHRAEYLTELSEALETRFEQRGDLGDLDQAIGLTREAVALTAAGHVNLAPRLSRLGGALRMRFRRTEDPADLDEAIDAVRAASEPDSPHRPTRLSMLGTSLLMRYETSSRPDDLDEAVDALRRGSGEVTDLANLGLALRIRFEGRGRQSDFEEALDVLGRTLAAMPPGDPERETVLSNVAGLHQERYVRSSDPDALERCIEAVREVLAVTPSPEQYRPMLGQLLYLRAEAQCDRSELDRAVATLRESLELSADRVGVTGRLAEMMHARFEATGRAADLEEAIELGRAAAADLRHPYHAELLSQLAGFLATRFQHEGARADLDEATRLIRAAVAADPADPGRQGNLAYILRLGRDPDEAVAVSRTALDGVPPGHPARPGHLLNLGAALLTAFERTARRDDLDEAVAALGEAAAADHPGRSRASSTLGVALRARWAAGGGHTDLDRAVTAFREAVATAPAGHTDRTDHLGNLGTVLVERFQQTGDRTDIDAAIDAGRSGLAAHPGPVRRAALASHLGAALQIRFRATGELADLDEAVRHGREAVAAAPAGDNLSNLGATLQIRYEHRRAPADLAEAVTLHEKALDAGGPDRAVMLSELGGALQARFTDEGDPRDLDRALAVCAEAVDLTDRGHSRWALRRYNLGFLHELRFHRSGRPEDLREALAAWQDTVANNLAPVSLRINAGARWGTAFADRREWPEAARGFQAAVRLLPLLAWRGTSEQSREGALAGWTGLAADAAAAAVAAGPAEEAVTPLELGRGVLWSQLLETRRDLADLRRAAPAMAARLEELRATLDEARTSQR